MKKSSLVAILVAILSVSSLHAQSLWTSAEVKAKLINNLNASAEIDYRTHDGMSSTERWAGTIDLTYKALPYLKVSGGYSYIHQRTETKVTKKGNVIPPYWQPKNRAYFSLTGSYKWNRFTFSLRERYQYTHRTEKSVPKFGSNGNPKDDELISGKDKNTLRSRLEVEYSIRGCNFTPFVSYELYNSLNNGFSSEKSRYTVGTDYKITKQHIVSLFYRYIDHSDDDEDAGNVIGIGYKFKF